MEKHDHSTHEEFQHLLRTIRVRFMTMQRVIDYLITEHVMKVRVCPFDRATTCLRFTDQACLACWRDYIEEVTADERLPGDIPSAPR